MNQVYHLKRVQKHENKRVEVFLSSVFKTKPNFWKWKFSIPQKEPLVSWVAVLPDGKPVSHYAYLPLTIVAGKERVQVALCTAMATDPRHRGRSLISQLNRFALADAEQQGAEICLGFSNPAGLKVDRYSTGYGYRIVGSFFTYAAIPAQTPDTDIALIPMKQNEAFRSWPATAHGLGVQKSARYLDWRYRFHPDKTHRCFRIVRGKKHLGYAVLRVKKSRIEILDLVLGKDEAILAALRACLAFSRKKKAAIVTVSVLKNTFWKDVLNQAGFYLLPKRAHHHLTIRTTRHTPNDLKRLFMKPNSWRLMGGDIL